MGVFDSFSSRFRLNEDDDDYENDEMDEYDEEEETPRRGGLFGRKSNYDDEDEEYDAPRSSRNAASASRSSAAPVNRSSAGAPAPSRTRSGAPAPASSRAQVCVIRPGSFDHARQITDTLLRHQTVLLNLEGLDVNTAQRIVDFASGSCYALHGNFMKISHFIIVITPEDVDISGDVAGVAPEAGAAAAFAGAAAAGSFAGAAQGRTGAPAGMNGAAPQDAGNPFMGSVNGMNGAY